MRTARRVKSSLRLSSWSIANAGTLGAVTSSLHCAAHRLDLGARRGRYGYAPHRVGTVHLAGGEQLDRLVRAADQSGRVERVGIELGDGELGELPQVNGLGSHFERIGETPLGQPPIHRHLAALEPGIGTAAGAGLLPLVALSRRLPQPRAGPSPHPFAGAVGAGSGLETG